MSALIWLTHIHYRSTPCCHGFKALSKALASLIYLVCFLSNIFFLIPDRCNSICSLCLQQLRPRPQWHDKLRGKDFNSFFYFLYLGEWGGKGWSVVEALNRQTWPQTARDPSNSDWSCSFHLCLVSNYSMFTLFCSYLASWDSTICNLRVCSLCLLWSV